MAAGGDGKIYLYDEVTRQQIAAMYGNGLKTPGHQLQVFSTRYLPNDNNILLTGGWDRTIKIYDTRCKYPVDNFLGPMICADALDVADDTIIAGSNRQEKPLTLFSLNMRKKILDIEFENPHVRDKTAGYVLGARFSKDKDSSVFFVCGAGKNEFRVYDNDTDH